MSGFLRITGVILRDVSKTHILSRDIVHEAKAQINIMPAHIRQGSVLDDDIRAKIIADRRKDAERAAWKLEQRLKALVFAMGDHRALDTADVTMTRLEGAWQLHQESHSNLANKYDEVVYRIRALARNFAPDVATPTADDVLKIIQNLDQRGHQMLERMAAVTRALEFKNKQLQELADCLCVKTPVTESSIFDDIMVKWSTDQSKFNDLHEALKKEGEEKRMATEALKDICRLMGVAYPSSSSSSLVADLKDTWTRSQGKVTDLEKALLQEKEKNQQSGEDIQNLAKFFGRARPLETGSKILDIIKGKWVQSKALVSELKSCLMFEKEKNLLANETMQGLASFMGVEPTGCEATMVGSMMDRWTESKREVNDLRRALLEEKEKAREVQGALQAYLNRPVALMSSTSTQTDDHQHQSAHRGKVADKSAQTESSNRPAPNGQILLRQSATFELKTPVSNYGEDITKPMLEDTLSNGGHLPMSLQPHQQKQQDRGSTSQVPLPTRGGTSVKLSHDIGGAGGVSGGNSNAVRKTRKRSSPLDQSVDRELQKIKEHPTMSISFRGSSQCRSFSLSPNCDLTYVDPRCRSLEPITASTMFSPPSKVSLVHGFSVIANAAPENCHELPALPDIIVTNMSDLVPWEESRPRIELGSGIAGTVFLFRHRESQQPVALKIVENPGQCFRNEVRIHQEISGLPWFPTFYGSFEIAGNQAALAMEFLGGGSDDKSYTIADCLENTGPVLTRDEWFDIFTDAADGLKSLHAFGFLSNDLKEDNVMLVKESGMWRAKIIDFGWASDISTPFVMNLDEEQIENYRNQGGCRHNAPECVLEGKPCSPSSDVYALGRLLAFVGQEMGYEDFLSYGRRIYYANQEQRPTVKEFIDELYDMQLVGGGEDGPGSSSC